MATDVLIGNDGKPIHCWAPAESIWYAKSVFPTPESVHQHIRENYLAPFWRQVIPEAWKGEENNG